MAHSVSLLSEVCTVAGLHCPHPLPHLPFGNPAEKKTLRLPSCGQAGCVPFVWKFLQGREILKHCSPLYPTPASNSPPYWEAFWILEFFVYSVWHENFSLFLKAPYLFFTFIKGCSWALKPNYSYLPEYFCVERINQVCQMLSHKTFNISKRFKAGIFITCIIENNPFFNKK